MVTVLGWKDLLFNAIFNIADMAISTGVGILIFSIAFHQVMQIL
jgi:lipoprotein signal peptidase